MKNSNKIINFPKKIDIKKKKYAVIRDEVESFLYQYACDEKDLWAVAMAAGRFSSIFLSRSISFGSTEFDLTGYKRKIRVFHFKFICVFLINKS